ncbi:DUF4114 domain-containing protein [Zoogloea sp.]|uniref:DUF4114 domain-containing protein n=1 Tax=Zoogloea sp. TaxID=49181 RepID=UPI00262179D3|nr:DUF4114 domain-containing protein [Zoogloea sp.]MDD3353545.1 DUF4114 domain-containing protein [Zoogloea sp.]
MKKYLALLLVSAVFGASAYAAPAPYGEPGTQNSTTYSYVAASSGDVSVYFAGGTGGYSLELGLLINGVNTGLYGLNNYTSSYGQTFNFGPANAGDALVFMIRNINPGNVAPWYSDVSLNSDGVNHVYSSQYSGDNLIPEGTFIAFEDLEGGGDFNYDDIKFVLTNVIDRNNSVPEPASLVLAGLGAAGLGFIRRRKAPQAS